MKSQQEIDDQIAALQGVLDGLPTLNARGDSYGEAIGAMVNVLQENTPEDDIPEKFLKAEPNASDFIMNCAFQSRDWLDGRRDEDLDLEFIETIASF